MQEREEKFTLKSKKSFPDRFEAPVKKLFLFQVL